MRILISNDDGVYAIGIIALANELAKIAEVTVVAPDRNRSGASNSLTVQNPVRILRLENGYYSVTGTPTDCVHVAVTGFFSKKFDMVVSGINAGENLGDDIIYSGTVAAATEGGILGIPALAFSLAGIEQPKHYKTAAKVARKVVEYLRKKSLPQGTILNINVPDVPIKKLRGFAVTRVGKRHPAQPAVKDMDPRGYPAYWIGASGPEEEAGPGTDFHAINNNKVSITPIQLDLTDYEAMESLRTWVKGL